MAAELITPSNELTVSYPSIIVPDRNAQWGDIAGATGLPPEDAWLINPYKDKFPTPVDDRGLVDIGVLIQAVKDTVDPNYKWPSHLSVHHFYWEEAFYRSVFAGEWARKFRELSIHKGIVPRVFENWLHIVTLPPDVPDPEVMRQRVLSWAVAEDLFGSVCRAVAWEKRARKRAEDVQNNLINLPEAFNGEDLLGKEILQEILRRHFRGVEMHLARLNEVPEEFRLVDPTDDTEVLAQQLGRLVGPRALHLVRAVAA